MQWRVWLVGLCIGCGGTVALAGGDGSAQQALTAYLSDFQELSAEFVQTVSAETGDVIQESRGSLAVSPPRRLRWDAREPYRESVIGDGEYLWYYDRDLAQVTQRPYPQALSELPALLFGSKPEAVASAYTVTHERDNHVERFTLRPRGAGGTFRSLVLRVVDGKPVALRLQDRLNQETCIRLEQVDLHPDLPTDTFAFVVPEGVDVIRAVGRPE